MSQIIKLKVEELNSLSPQQIVENEVVEQKFIEMYNNIHGGAMGATIYHKEKFNFIKILSESPKLQACSKLSIYGAFLDIAVNGLSLDTTGRPHIYLIPRKSKTGRKDQAGKDIYEERMNVSVTAYGEVTMRQRAGQIKYADNPVIVYEGDTFEAGTRGGVKFVEHSTTIPRKSNKIIACYIKIYRTDGTTDFQWLLPNDIERLKHFSEKANSYYKDGVKQEGKANELYTSNGGQIDPGFLENKMIKHAFDVYPKVRTGNFSILQTQDLPDEIDLNYGIEEAVQDAMQVEGAQAQTVIPETFDSTHAETVEPEGTQIPLTDSDEEGGF